MKTPLKVLAIIQIVWGGWGGIFLISEGYMDIWTFALMSLLVGTGIVMLVDQKKERK